MSICIVCFSQYISLPEHPLALDIVMALIQNLVELNSLNIREHQTICKLVCQADYN